MNRKPKRRPFAGEIKSGLPPSGIIRTLPYFGASEGGELRDSSQREAMNKAYARMMRALKAVEKGRKESVLIAFPARPTIEVLHIYLIVGGKVRVRGNLAGFIEGERVGRVGCWDDSVRSARWWAIMCAPIVWPPETILRRGFQGFRYTQELIEGAF